MIRIGIDPGVRECGVAIEFDPLLSDYSYSAFIVLASDSALHDRALSMARQAIVPIRRGEHIVVCIEGQQVYRSESAKGDPNDIVKLATVAGVMLGVIAQHGFCDVSMPLPRQWKGGIKKDKHHPRLKRDYPYWVEPVAADTPKSLQHHVWDAVGLLEWRKERSNT